MMKNNQTTLLSILLFAFLCFSQMVNAQHWSITNVAGDGTSDPFIEGVNALETPIGIPAAMAIDSEGNIYFIVVGWNDLVNSGIYKINSSDNVVTHIADELPGIAGIAIDGADNIYFTRGEPGPDSGQPSSVKNYIYKLSAEDGAITTIAGNGFAGEAPIAESDAHSNPVGGAGAVKMDPSGEYLYYTTPYRGTDVAEVNYIQKIKLSTSMTERVAGAGGGDGETNIDPDLGITSVDLAVGFGMEWDAAGNFYFATYDNMIKKIVDGKIIHVAGTGEADFSGDGSDAGAAALDLSFSGLYRNSNNELILADSENHRMRKIDLSGNSSPDGTITTICGTGFDEDSGEPSGDLLNGFFKVAYQANIKPYDIKEYNGELYFTDQNRRIRKAFICENPVITDISADLSVLCLGDSVTLTLSKGGGESEYYIWGWLKDECDVDGDAFSNGPSIKVPVKSEAVTYYAYGYGGCAYKQECFPFEVKADCKEYYNSFTPNADGKNDYLEIPGLNNFPVNTVVIFNRWGDILEELENYDSETVKWEGTNGGGDPVDSGTYFFTAESGGEVIISGWVHLIRE